MDHLTGADRPDLRRVVICYDVTDDARRYRLAQAILDLVGRVQWSHYDGWLPAGLRSQVWPRLAPLLGTGDRLLALCLCPTCAAESGAIGAEPVPPPPSSWLV